MFLASWSLPRQQRSPAGNPYGEKYIYSINLLSLENFLYALSVSSLYTPTLRHNLILDIA